MSKAAPLIAGSIAALGLFWGGIAFGDEGLWTFDHFPATQVEQTFGVKIDSGWLDHVRAASVRFDNGCSASIVSADGLVFSAHHCLASCLQDLSTDKTDYMRDGFAALTRKEERECPGLQVEVLLSISDVSDRVGRAVVDKTGEAFIQARNAVIAVIEDAGCAKDPTLRCEVVNLYNGGQFKLYKYHKYTDVRIVFAPEYATASFGGDPDNFNFPRYELDIGFCRLYENGEPVKTPQHLSWAKREPRDGEPTFLSGSPDATNRTLTVAQLEVQRDLRLPIVQTEVAELRGRIIRFAEESPENKRVSADPLANVENYFKFNSGVQLALNDKALLDAKRVEEAALRAKVAADPRLAAKIGDPWAEIAKAQSVYADTYLRYRMLQGPSATLFSYAITLVRAAQERAKPSTERLPEYSDASLALVRKQLLDDRSVDPGLDQLLLEFWLSKTRERLTADDPTVQLILGRESPEDLAARAVKQSKLADAKVRKALWDGGLAAINASDDPIVQLAIRLDPAARESRRIWEAEVTGPSEAAAARITAARFAIHGDTVYPNGTRSPRVTYGKVAGWTSQGRTIAAFTTFSGLYERATGAEPFQLPARWIAAKDRLNLGAVFNFVITNDGAPGISGAPVLSAAGEVLGAEFDGNIYAVGADYGYDERTSRLIAVSASAVTEALTKVYGQQVLVKELISGQSGSSLKTPPRPTPSPHPRQPSA